MSERNLTLLTDFYELTMMQGYFKEKDANETVIFDAFYRNNPVGSGYSICAGLDQVIDYVKNLHFDEPPVCLRKISSTISAISISAAIFMPFRKEASYSQGNRL